MSAVDACAAEIQKMFYSGLLASLQDVDCAAYVDSLYCRSVVAWSEDIREVSDCVDFVFSQQVHQRRCNVVLPEDDFR